MSIQDLIPYAAIAISLILAALGSRVKLSETAAKREELDVKTQGVILEMVLSLRVEVGNLRDKAEKLKEEVARHLDKIDELTQMLEHLQATVDEKTRQIEQLEEQNRLQALRIAELEKNA